MTRPVDQHDAWAAGEAADAWFERNKPKLTGTASGDKATRLFAAHISAGQRVLEIGVANGHRLDRLRELSGCDGFGIDPSPAAIVDGTAKYDALHLAVGTAEKLGFPDGFFDAVIFGFCLYLVDRRMLAQVVAEADRVLAFGGRLMIVDFDPATPCRRPFVHHPGLWSYKMCYPNLWLANPEYVLAEKVCYSHDGEVFHADPGERVGAWVLIKQEMDAGYPEMQ